jgi:hypothetical protein
MIAPIPCVWRNPVSPPAEAYPMGRRPSHVVGMGMGLSMSVSVSVSVSMSMTRWSRCMVRCYSTGCFQRP